MFENIRLSFKGIFSHKIRSLLTMLGIIIGIAAIIAIVSTIKGTNEQIKSNLIGAGNNTVKIQLYQGDGVFDFQYQSVPYGIPVISDEVKEQIEDIKEIESVLKPQIEEDKKKVIEAGGLRVIGSERHESRRIDNQLRGRSGRQGDPGVTQFYLSLEDDLMLRFGSERIKHFYETMNIADDTVIQSKMITRQVESAQKRVEGNNYDTRKQVLQYDDVMRAQREVIYSQRQQVIMETDSLKPVIMPMIKRTVEHNVQMNTVGDKKDWNLDGIVDFAIGAMVNEDSISKDDFAGKSQEEIVSYLMQKAEENYAAKEAQLNDKAQMLEFEKVVILRVVDARWTDHIDEMDQLRQSIGLRGYGQLNPLVEYQSDGFRMFEQMVGDIEYDVTRLFLKAEIRQNISR